MSPAFATWLGLGWGARCPVALFSPITDGAILWLAVRPFGNVRGDTFQNEFADQIPYSIGTRARQTIEND